MKALKVRSKSTVPMRPANLAQFGVLFVPHERLANREGVDYYCERRLQGEEKAVRVAIRLKMWRTWQKVLLEDDGQRKDFKRHYN